MDRAGIENMKLQSQYIRQAWHLWPTSLWSESQDLEPEIPLQLVTRAFVDFVVNDFHKEGMAVYHGHTRQVLLEGWGKFQLFHSEWEVLATNVIDQFRTTTLASQS